MVYIPASLFRSLFFFLRSSQFRVWIGYGEGDGHGPRRPTKPSLRTSSVYFVFASRQVIPGSGLTGVRPLSKWLNDESRAILKPSAPTFNGNKEALKCACLRNTF